MVEAKVTVASDGTTWYVHSDMQLYRKAGNIWEWDGIGKATQASVANSSLMWCVNSDGDIHRCEGARAPFNWVKETPETNHVPKAKHVSAGSDGTVYCISTNNKLYKRKGYQWTLDAKGGAGIQVSVGRNVGNYDLVWIVTDTGKLYSMKEDGTWRLEGAPSSNDQVVPVAKRVSVGHDGSIWAIDTQNRLWRRDTNASTHSGHWKEPNAHEVYSWVSVGDGNHICGVDHNGTVQNYEHGRWNPVTLQLRDAVVTTPPNFSQYEIYTMPDNGKGLRWVAEIKGITYESLLAANPEYRNNPNHVKAGAKLNVPWRTH